MGYLFMLLWLISPVFLFAGLVQPTIFSGILKRTPTRLQILLTFIVTFISLFILAGTTLPSKESGASSRPTPTVTAVLQVTITLTPAITVASDEAKMYSVTKVVDGDTIKVSMDGKYETVRLIGVDTPETVDPRKPVQCFGKEASNKMSELLGKNKVILEADGTQGDKDKYNRLLRYIFLADGTHINKVLIEQGYAYEYTYDLPYKYQNEFKTVQIDAREKKRGLWADNVCVTLSPSPFPTNIIAPSATPWPTSITYPTTGPTTYIYVPPTSAPIVPAINSGSGFSCDCSKACSRMASCEEAYYQLNNCSCSARDGDDDGVPCENICPGG